MVYHFTFEILVAITVSLVNFFWRWLIWFQKLFIAYFHLEKNAEILTF
jgi:hypothetical protein